MSGLIIVGRDEATQASFPPEALEARSFDGESSLLAKAAGLKR